MKRIYLSGPMSALSSLSRNDSHFRTKGFGGVSQVQIDQGCVPLGKCILARNC